MWRAKRSRMHENDDDGHFDDSEESEDSSTDDDDDKPSIRHRLRKVLKMFETIGATEFVISGALSDAPLHVIRIKQTQKIIRFPLFEDDLPSIIDAFKQSPYGNSWHLDPDDFEIINPKWTAYVTDVLVARIRQEMAITTAFKASLYKLLLYQSGSFFKPHRDTEKEDGMFATLVVQLPSRFDGGQLVIEHDNTTKKLDFSTNTELANMYTTFFSAFYCDCKHEILPVTDGTRMCLVYNLVTTETDASRELPTAPMVSDVEMQMASVCTEWRNTNTGPVKIVYGLSHKYTERSLSFTNLKSTDRSVANALIKFAKHHSLVVLLGTLEKTWEGDETFEHDESAEGDVAISYSLKHLEMIGQPHSSLPESFTAMSVDDGELISKHCFRDVSPFDRHEEETGNEGTTLTLSYRHSALVVFPVENVFTILMNERRGDEAERTFVDRCKQFEMAGRNDEAEKKQLLRWAHLLITKPSWRRGPPSLPLLSAISTLNDLPVLQKFLENFRLDEKCVEPVAALCDTYGWNVLSEHLAIGFKKLNQETALKVVDTLVGNTGDLDGKDEKKKVCQTLIACIPSSNENQFGYLFGRRYPTVEFVYKFCALAERLNLDPKEYLAALPFEVKEQSVDSIVKLCDTYGWDAFGEQLVNGLKSLTQEIALRVLDALVGHPADFVGKDEKKKVCLTLIDVVPKSTASYARLPNGEFLYNFCTLADRLIDYDPMPHLTGQRIEIMVPVLVKLASTTNGVLAQRWRAVADHFLSKMQTIAASADQTPVWTRNDRVPCTCEDCAVLAAFMRANRRTTEFKVNKKRRLHLESIVDRINHLTFTTEASGRPQKMVITKNLPSAYAASQEQIIAREMVSRLTAILPSH
ncbi:uncharacterized protein LOC119079025 isoform X2 [Bradysia coprophila]|uniref:uncharacterized protein LOC119079025 isoform X2 n=1 Tax=Bradysia coprophila TaxID=38358 RepID=UPI00187DDA83|nr:uncharacterized protein LOC119079025 isoform X2 [Bradysia coprophila]